MPRVKDLPLEESLSDDDYTVVFDNATDVTKRTTIASLGLATAPVRSVNGRTGVVVDLADSADLATKADLVHTHTESEITDLGNYVTSGELSTGLSTKSDVGHSHTAVDLAYLIDEDDMVSNSDVHVPSQQSTRAYVISGTVTMTNKTLTSPVIGTSILPTSNDGAAIGSTTLNFSDLYLASGGTINWNNGTVTLEQASNRIDFTTSGTIFRLASNGALQFSADTSLTRSSAGVLAVGGVAVPTISSTSTLTNKTLTAPVLGGTITGTYTLGGTPTFPSTVVSTTGTQTLTDKRLTSRVNTVASSATPAINTDTTDEFTITALATAITSMTSSLTGTPVNGDELMIRFKDDGTARAITWGASFVSGPATLLATTAISKTHYVKLRYDSTAAKWVCMASDAVGY